MSVEGFCCDLILFYKRLKNIVVILYKLKNKKKTPDFWVSKIRIKLAKIINNNI